MSSNTRLLVGRSWAGSYRAGPLQSQVLSQRSLCWMFGVRCLAQPAFQNGCCAKTLGRQAYVCPNGGATPAKLAQIWDKLDQHLPSWPGIDQLRADFDRVGAELGPFRRTSQIWPEFDQLRPNMTRNRPKLAQSRPNLGRHGQIDQKWLGSGHFNQLRRSGPEIAELSATSPNSGPNSVKFGTDTLNFDRTSPEFDQTWPVVKFGPLGEAER